MDIFDSSERQVLCVANDYRLYGDDPSRYLNVGERYTVIGVDIYEWYTLVTLAEFPDQEFNSVLFEEIW